MPKQTFIQVLIMEFFVSGVFGALVSLPFPGAWWRYSLAAWGFVWIWQMANKGQSK